MASESGDRSSEDGEDGEVGREGKAEGALKQQQAAPLPNAAKDERRPRTCLCPARCLQLAATSGEENLDERLKATVRAPAQQEGGGGRGKPAPEQRPRQRPPKPGPLASLACACTHGGER